MLSAEIIFTLWEDESQCIFNITERKRSYDKISIGRRNDKPILDTQKYLVKYADGTDDMMKYSRVIKHLCSQVDTEGKQLHIYRGIVGHLKIVQDVDKADQFSENNGRRYKKNMIDVWDLEVELKYSSTSWLPLSQLKKYNPLDVVCYALDNQIANEMVFNRWAQEVLKRSLRLINAAKPKKKRCTTESDSIMGFRFPRPLLKHWRLTSKMSMNFGRNPLRRSVLKCNYC